ncbi:hypothetical protein BJV74DRAFT_867511 [Russula compacta]|nr:hypothetical protein BJV74DRAFT_867511 [Russula compacta]
MAPIGSPTEQEIIKIARRTIDIIQSNITSDVCLFGGAASYLWADIGRVPNDIDIVVSDYYNYYDELDAEDIKETIVEVDDLLYCRLPGWHTDRRCVKVDILVPPTLGLPEVYPNDVDFIEGIPVMPLFDLLVMKLQGWWDHRTSTRTDFRAKAPADVRDVLALLDRAETVNVSYDDQEYKHEQEFMDRGRTLARRFVNVYGGRKRWRGLGFLV